ncbi:hypothetical protein FB45DRAFT_1065134 [Roridomyces roridus]|uniref:F-box domain-containing protein n=1 Tax=Roridomyces roridus TaxID=1738132 RepID=A0AAD7FD05_9AGAR|nr:hypothetical protein FB45DRAFT_1065134 [Roridomyces roridus]
MLSIHKFRQRIRSLSLSRKSTRAPLLRWSNPEQRTILHGHLRNRWLLSNSLKSTLHRLTQSLWPTFANRLPPSPTLSRTRRRSSEISRSSTELLILSPMARLPFELSSQIFALTIPTPPTWAALTKLMSVCPAQFPLALKLWLARGRDLPVPVSTPHLRWDFANHELTGALEADSHRVESLEGVWSSNVSGAKPFRVLKSLTVGHESGYTDFAIEHILSLLDRAPQLVECTWLLQNDASVSFPPPERQSFHAALQHFRLEYVRGGGDFTPDILKYLMLPSLTLNAPFLVESLHPCLKRSAPPLQSLKLCTRRVLDASKGDFSFLGLAPTLTDLELRMDPS